MAQVEEISGPLYRAILFAILLYFALFLYATATGDPTAGYATEFVFGGIAIGVGVILALQVGVERPLYAGIVACLVVGGAVQFAYLFTRAPLLDLLSSLLVFAGIGIYLLAVWNAD